MPGRRPPRFIVPEVCPVCGEDVPRGALACPECGADERSGWREDAASGDDSEDEFDYDEFVKDEFGTRIKPRGLPVFWWIAAIIVIAILCFVFLRRGGF